MGKKKITERPIQLSIHITDLMLINEGLVKLKYCNIPNKDTGTIARSCLIVLDYS